MQVICHTFSHGWLSPVCLQRSFRPTAGWSTKLSRHLVIDTYVYREGLLGLRYSYTAAIGFLKSILAMLLILSANLLAKLLGREGIW